MSKIGFRMFAAALLLSVAVTGCGKSQMVSEGVTSPPPQAEPTTTVAAVEPAPSSAPQAAPAPEAPAPVQPAPVAADPDPGLHRIHFDYDKALLRPDAREVLESNAKHLARTPGGRVRIEGHCDERGTAEYNLALGDRRAQSAFQYLVDLGVDADRLEMISYGDEKPLASGHDENTWAQNRRVEFVETRN